eukprot:m.419486 g.419486  ORF g.419486 m.419486 type:complete len:351 (-) comp31583_c0_seq1:166-1218(-)
MVGSLARSLSWYSMFHELVFPAWWLRRSAIGTRPYSVSLVELYPTTLNARPHIVSVAQVNAERSCMSASNIVGYVSDRYGNRRSYAPLMSFWMLWENSTTCGECVWASSWSDHHTVDSCRRMNRMYGSHGEYSFVRSYSSPIITAQDMSSSRIFFTVRSSWSTWATADDRSTDRCENQHSDGIRKTSSPWLIAFVANRPRPPAVNLREWPDTEPNTAPDRSIQRASSSYAGSSLATRGSICLAIRLLQIASLSSSRRALLPCARFDSPAPGAPLLLGSRSMRNKNTTTAAIIATARGLTLMVDGAMVHCQLPPALHRRPLEIHEGYRQRNGATNSRNLMEDLRVQFCGPF